MLIKKTSIVLVALISLCWLRASVAGSGAVSPPTPQPPVTPEGKSKVPLKVTLKECVDIAIKNNHQRPVSQLALEAAEAQHKQALSAYWPQVTARAAYTTLDDDPNFIFPAKTIPVPSQTITIPANAFGPGFPPVPVPLSTPAGRFQVPEQDVKLMDRRNLVTSLNLNYPLFTGGLRSAKVKQAKCGVEVAKQEARRTDLQVMYDVHRMYYGVILAKQLHQIGRDALDRLSVTQELTEKLYKGGSLKVKKTDYLRSKSTVQGVTSLVAALKSNEQLAQAALLNTMGLDWDTKIEVTETAIPYQPYRANLAELISQAYQFNPDWAKLKFGLEAAQAKIKEARSGHFPKVLLTGSLNHIENQYNKGVVTAQNRDNWCIGLMMELPIFEGFLTQNKIREARANFNKMEEQKILLREGIALQVKDIFYKLNKSQEQHKAAKEAMEAATENRDLNERAYQSDLVETKDVLEAQIMESFMQAQYHKVLYDHVETKAHLNFIVGQEVVKLLEGKNPGQGVVQAN